MDGWMDTLIDCNHILSNFDSACHSVCSLQTIPVINPDKKNNLCIYYEIKAKSPSSRAASSA